MIKPERIVDCPTTSNQSPEPAFADNDNYTTNKYYKKIISENHNCCCFGCCVCKDVGNTLLKIQFNDFKNVLLEDDNPLIFQLFGRDLTK